MSEQPRQTVNVKKVAWIASAVYAALLVAAAVLSWDFTQKPDEYVKLLAAWIAALTSLLAAAVSITVLLSQQKASEDLERLKGDVATSVKIVEFSMGQTAKASEAVSTAVSNYYYVLATLEQGKLLADDVKAAEYSMRQARARLIDLLPGVRKAFDDFHQVGANVVGDERKAIELLGDGKDKDKAKDEVRRKIWKDYVATFGAAYKEAEAALLESQRQAREGKV